MWKPEIFQTKLLRDELHEEVCNKVMIFYFFFFFQALQEAWPVISDIFKCNKKWLHEFCFVSYLFFAHYPST